MSDLKRKFGLDLIRAVAISLVLLAHFARGADFVGIYGVELFFALSGFLIGGIIYRRLVAREQWSFAEVKLFWLRRWWRTLPNYYLFLLILVLFHHTFGGLPAFRDLLPYAAFLQNFSNILPGFYAVSWSLCVEEWFYLLFPLCILLFTSMRMSKRGAFLGTTCLFLFFPPLLREHLFASTSPATVGMMTIPRLDAIFYGVAVSFFVARHDLSARQRFSLLIVALVGVTGLLLLQRQCAQTGDLLPFYRAAFIGVPLCFSLTLPFFAALGNLPASMALLERSITSLSLWSYSIYLSHIPILFATYAAFGSSREHPLINLASKVIGLVLCLGVSRFLYLHFESKLMQLRPDDRVPVPNEETAPAGVL